MALKNKLSCLLNIGITLCALIIITSTPAEAQEQRLSGFEYAVQDLLANNLTSRQKIASINEALDTHLNSFTNTDLVLLENVVRGIQIDDAHAIPQMSFNDIFSFTVEKRNLINKIKFMTPVQGPTQSPIKLELILVAISSELSVIKIEKIFNILQHSPHTKSSTDLIAAAYIANGLLFTEEDHGRYSILAKTAYDFKLKQNEIWNLVTTKFQCYSLLSSPIINN